MGNFTLALFSFIDEVTSRKKKNEKREKACQQLATQHCYPSILWLLSDNRRGEGFRSASVRAH